jgi:broad specificity phosphatase PhoE
MSKTTDMTDWYWVRHGPTHEKTFVGWRNVAVDLSNTELINRIALFLPETAVVVSSDLRRSIETANALEHDRKRLSNEVGLREFNFGDWDGKHFSDVSKTDPILSRAYWDNPGDIKAPNGESWNMAAQRARTVVDRLSKKYDQIIAVAHFGIILTQVQRALGASAYECLSQKIDNFSITHLQEKNGKWQLNYVNSLP